MAAAKGVCLQPWPRMVKFLPLLSTAEKEALTESLKQYGLKHPILALKDGRIIDGYHRWQILGEAAVPQDKIEFVDLDEETAFGLGISLNLDRRHLTPELIREKREWQRKAYLDLRNKLHYTQERSAKIVGAPRSTTEDWENISNNETVNANIPDLRISIPTKERERIVERIAKGDTQEQIAADYKVTQGRVSQIFSSVNEAKKKKAEPLPEGLFDVIYADPPWEYSNDGFDRGTVPYETMKIAEICALKVPTPENAILFLWATNPMLEDALKVVNAWSFDYKTNMVWVKPHIGTGFYVRGQHELLLICRKGQMPQPNPESRPPSVIEAPTTEHSAKPPQVYEIIEKMYPDSKRLELFARNSREGWTSWGDELRT